MRSAAEAAGVSDVYVAHDWKPLWTQSTADELDRLVAERRRHGLDRVAISVAEVADKSPAQRDVARTSTALRYAKALAQGSVDPTSLHEVYTFPRPDNDLTAGLEQAASDGTLADWFGGLAPQNAEYSKLSDAYVRYRQEAESADASRIADSGLIEIGDTDARVPAILEQLRANGYLSTEPKSGEAAQTYDDQMADAIRRLQAEYGIADDGVIGRDTLTVLNLGPRDRARALAVALERRRWLARSPAATRIDVNAAAARMRYFRDGNRTDSRKVIVGEPGNETPALLSPIYRLVANPTWTVPKSIQNGELSGVSQGYLDSRNMAIQGGWIVQQPGPDNALGLVKFDMQNQHAIYLHDTSSPELFDQSQRQLSHGCVRVEDALGFAQMLAEQQGITDEWEKARGSGNETFVPLPEHIPVRLLYHNVFVDDAGAVAFRTDPYGWNDPIAQALGFEKSNTRRSNAKGADVGP
ncbi:L,D-transpeptidase family protein [Sphingomonas japonica]|uniref:Murein L,D-transpeptidase YcbB/YkuD n=1 Tax=Sphingomonas japonica TaxID=511662 RepID=A0ABX0U3U4_9SPHN|nr:L,D-transpeptidase family protein [Sphingomonas japonica]NIJ25253.1 murein L,D-transpeptidase YcbB/YkuD [Sphingomonas japonica]